MQLYKLGEDKIIAKVNYIDICTLRWQEVERELYIYVNLFIILTPNFLSVKFAVAIFCDTRRFTERYM